MTKSAAQLDVEDDEARRTPDPRCLHGAVWNTCDTCACTAWCDDCGERLVLDEPLHQRESVTCESCVDRMIHPQERVTRTVR
jgi:hypothetical protein